MKIMNANPEFQLILLPGLGADYRLLQPQREAFPQLIVPPWIPPEHGESMAGYAARMAGAIPRATDRPLVLGGVSFGGMLAFEMARHLKPDALVLIASCRSRHSLRPIYQVGRVLLPRLPVFGWEIAKMLSDPVVRLRRGVPESRRELAVAMFKEMDSHFMHWVLQTLLAWEPEPLEGVRIYQIHGRRDSLIPANRVEADQFIADGGHLINMTHAEEVNEFIARSVC